MKTKLLLLLVLLTINLGFSQNHRTLQSDGKGKLFFQSETHQKVETEQSLKMPSILNLDWSEPDFDISNNPTKDSWDPRLDVGAEGKVYVVYNDNRPNGLQKIMFRKKIDGEWSIPISVDTGVDIGDRNNHFPAIAASPNGDLHVTYNVWAYENVRNYVGYSHYSATTDSWSSGIKISDLNGTVNHTYSHHDIYSTSDNLPVVVWGFDNRENQTNEEIYLTYFDGANWSNDMAVSDITDGENAGYPRIKSIGNNKAMIVYSEDTNGGGTELRYKLYDEDTHTLTAPKIIATSNIFMDNYVLVTSGSGDVMVLTLHKESSPSRDVFNVYDYDLGDDSFLISSNSYEIPANAGGLLKQVTMDCNGEDDCAVVYTDFLAETNTFVEYHKTTGFGAPLIINEENPVMDPPSARFDPEGNLHIVWDDMRFDNGDGFDEREVFYKIGKNANLGIDQFSTATINIFPNPSKGIFTIQNDGNYTMELIDVLGKVLDTQRISGSIQLERQLAAGTYFLRFTNNRGTLVKRLLIE